MQTEQQIHLNENDNCFQRARNILRHAGIIEGVGLAQRMAESIEAYRVMDQNKPAGNPMVPVMSQEQVEAMDAEETASNED